MNKKQIEFLDRAIDDAQMYLNKAKKENDEIAYDLWSVVFWREYNIRQMLMRLADKD